MAKKPRLTENTKRRRVEIAEENIAFLDEIWRKTIFIDEFSFETGPKGQIRVRRMRGTRDDPENILPIQNSGWSSVMCCACFSYAGIGPIVRSVGNFNSNQYVQYLEDHVMPYAETVFPDMDFYILHDNSRIHTSYQTLGYLILRFGPERVIAHAPYSPDCNPIENLFGILSRIINRKRQIFASNDLLWLEIQSQWQQLGLDVTTLRNLAKSMPDRYREVIEKNGSITRY
jgi:hypothetical protein